MDGVESTDLVRVRKVREIRRILSEWHKWDDCTDPAVGKCNIVPLHLDPELLTQGGMVQMKGGAPGTQEERAPLDELSGGFPTKRSLRVATCQQSLAKSTFDSELPTPKIIHDFLARSSPGDEEHLIGNVNLQECGARFHYNNFNLNSFFQSY